MDAHRRLNTAQGDNALRELFRESGHHRAPEGMEARILQRLAVMPAPVRSAEPALIPKWMWSGAGALMLVCMGLLLAQPGQSGDGLLQRYVPEVPSLSLDVFTSGWFLMAASCGLLLLAADTLLARRAAR
ncbi:MAG: hypothetical protein IPJ76_12960 [Flavobacteriales bacterium]|nr:MAG: hypothetical protein IPJ76_12960 [Flavobacteriales bacterium]